MGFRLFDDIDNDLRDDYRQTISTGCEELDKALYGGLGKGELGLIISPLGTGKTSVSTGFAAAAATTFTEANNWMGYKVLHFFLRMKKSVSDVNIMGICLILMLVRYQTQILSRWR